MHAPSDMSESGPRWRVRAERAARLASFAVAVIAASWIVLILLYRFVDPPFSALMVWRAVSGQAIERQWVDLENIAPALPAAVIASEDQNFCQHSGIDWGALGSAIDEMVEDGEGRPRGASTIAMQTVKNLFLWPSRSYVRKAIEMPLALLADFVWPKRRTMEIYLNIAEWAPGVFGAEAAARHHFGKPATDLSRREAALLAAALPNPHGRDAGRPGPLTRRLARGIERRMRTLGERTACLESG